MRCRIFVHEYSCVHGRRLLHPSERLIGEMSDSEKEEEASRSVGLVLVLVLETEE